MTRPTTRPARRSMCGPVIATAAVAGLGACVIGPWWPREPARDAGRNACDAVRPVAASTRDTAVEVAALARRTERMHRDTAASLAPLLAAERGRDPDAGAAWVSPTAAAIATNERLAEAQRRSAEGWDQLAAKAEAELAAISGRCGTSHG